MSRHTGNGSYALSLSFAQVACSCGGQRVRGVACPECRRRPERHEFDLEWQRRSRVAGEVLEALAAKGD
jgi:hypothetical protein